MVGAKHVAALSAVVCVLVVMAMVGEASAECNLNALLPCLQAMKGTKPPHPSPKCCTVVKKVDKKCMCTQLKSSSFPAQMVANALRLPKKCGRKDFSGFNCGRSQFPK